MLERKEVMITIRTQRIGVAAPLFRIDGAEDAEEYDEEYAEELDEEALAPEGDGEPEEAEIMTEGRLVTTSRRADLVYEESELTGMEGSVSKLGFDLDRPELVSMLRSGSVSTALIFEPHRRHICVYQTPFSEFEVCVQTLEIRNRLLTAGELYLDYLIEIHGAKTERCKMYLSIK